MKILVTGAQGQVGSDVMKELLGRGHLALGRGRGELDITNREAVQSTLAEIRPDAVIHCAAWTGVDAAETAPLQARQVNAAGTRYVAEACLASGCKLLYLSTDYVFSGEGTRPWEPLDARRPVNVYGQTKCEGEEAVEACLSRYFIVRTSWVFGAHGKNFVQTMLRMGRQTKRLTVVNDQVGSPTYAPHLSRLLADIVETERYGHYHATNEGFCSWYDFAREIFSQAGALDPSYRHVEVLPVPSSEYPTPARRPKNSRLNKDRLTKHGFQPLPDWKRALNQYLQEAGAEGWDN